MSHTTMRQETSGHDDDNKLYLMNTSMVSGSFRTLAGDVMERRNAIMMIQLHAYMQIRIKGLYILRPSELASGTDGLLHRILALSNNPITG